MQKLEETLRTLLAHNIVSFTFYKVNGEIRHAKGTRNLTLASNYTGSDIPAPVYGEQPYSYYDVEKDGWRSYKPENLISIDGVYARTDTDFAKKPTLPNEEPKREIPIKFHTADGTDIPIGTAKTLGNPICEELPIGNGKSVRVKMQPVDLFDLSGLFGVRIPKEEVPEPMNENACPTDDFARLVARYVVDEIANRLKLK